MHGISSFIEDVVTISATIINRYVRAIFIYFNFVQLSSIYQLCDEHGI